MIVYLLTEEQKELLINKEFKKDSYFNPLEDNEGNWILSEYEVENCDNSEFEWIKKLETIDYNLKPVETHFK